jgi:hypothetical protein
MLLTSYKLARDFEYADSQVSLGLNRSGLYGVQTTGSGKCIKNQKKPLNLKSKFYGIIEKSEFRLWNGCCSCIVGAL